VQISARDITAMGSALNPEMGEMSDKAQIVDA
jgi:hypothetical protein